MRKIILAIDDSTYSQKVVDLLAGRHWEDDLEVKILTVIEPIELDDSEKHKQLLTEINDQRKQQARKLLETARQAISDRLRSAVHFEIREGNPKTEIVNAAVEWSADKILIGAHGHGRSAPGVGSIPRTVAAHAPCSVEVIRAR